MSAIPRHEAFGWKAEEIAFVRSRLPVISRAVILRELRERFGADRGYPTDGLRRLARRLRVGEPGLTRAHVSREQRLTHKRTWHARRRTLERFAARRIRDMGSVLRRFTAEEIPALAFPHGGTSARSGVLP